MGPFFARHFKKNNIQIHKGETLADIVTMYEILLGARGKTPQTASMLDEQIALGAICKFRVPGKKRKYIREAAALRARFRGIGRSEELRTLFTQSVRDEIAAFRVVEDVKMRTLADIFTGFDPVPAAAGTDTATARDTETGLAA